MTHVNIASSTWIMRSSASMTSTKRSQQHKYGEERKTFERLVSALDFNSPLMERLNICGTDAGTYPRLYTRYCNQPPCPRCRGRYRRKQAKSLVERFQDTPSEDMALMTIVLEPSACPRDAFNTFDAARQAIRNLRTRRHWPAIQIAGWLETDALCDDDMPLIGSNRRALLGSLGHAPTKDGAPLWWPSIHGIVALDNLAHQEFRLDLSTIWAAQNQVDVRPLYEEMPVSVSVKNIVDYSVKHKCSQRLAGFESPWAPDWLAKYYSDLYELKSGFRGLCFNMGLMKRRDSSFIDSQTQGNEYEGDNIDEYDCMPMVI